MQLEKPRAKFLREFKEFLTFTQHLWGFLGGMSLFFPLSNIFVQVVPLKSISQDGSFRILDPNLISFLSTIVTLFFILETFSKRKRISGIVARRQAMRIFVFGIVMLIIYLFLYYFPRHNDNWIKWDSEDMRHLFFELPMMLIYCLIFASITKAFMLMGMMEYFNNESSGESLMH